MKAFFAGLLLIAFTGVAHATCPSSLVLQDANGTKAPARYSDDGSGNCMPNVVIGPSVTSTIALAAGNTVIGFTTSDPCAQTTKNNTAISATTGTVQVVSGVASKKVYMCSLSLIANAVVSVSVVEGTGSLCASSEAAVIGSTVSTTGMAFTTNGGLTLGNGSGTVGITGTAGNGICLLQSLTTSIVSGNLTYVQQ